VGGEHRVQCNVVEPIKTKGLDAVPLFSEPRHLELTPEAGPFAEIEIGNQTGQTCPATIKGVNPVRGEQLRELEQPSEDLVSQELECTAAGSVGTLFLGTNAVTFEGLVERETTDKWFWDAILA
jgi:hypothetical protein